MRRAVHAGARPASRKKKQRALIAPRTAPQCRRGQGGALAPRRAIEPFGDVRRAYADGTYFLGSLYMYLYMSSFTTAVLAYSMVAQRSALNVRYL